MATKKKPTKTKPTKKSAKKPVKKVTKKPAKKAVKKVNKIKLQTLSYMVNLMVQKIGLTKLLKKNYALWLYTQCYILWVMITWLRMKKK